MILPTNFLAAEPELLELEDELELELELLELELELVRPLELELELEELDELELELELELEEEELLEEPESGSMPVQPANTRAQVTTDSCTAVANGFLLNVIIIS